MLTLHVATALLAVTGVGDTALLDFHAQWCGPCKQMAPAVDRLIADGQPVLKIDIDQQPELAQKYGVTAVPTFVMVVNGQEVARESGAVSAQRLQAMLAMKPAAAAPVTAPANARPATFPAHPAQRPMRDSLVYPELRQVRSSTV